MTLFGSEKFSAFPRDFENYKLLCSCGRGAFGEVFVAEDLSGHRVALKIIPDSPAGARELDGLRHYRKISGEHPNLVRIFHIGSSGSALYYTMELADNLNEGSDGSYRAATLAEIIHRHGALETAEVIRIGHAILDGLASLEQNGLIHRDIKPSNIIFVNNVPKLSDLGLLTDTTRSVSIAGTFGFLPPETLEGHRSGENSGDLYSFGKVLYCALTGQAPQKYPWIPQAIPLSVCRQFRPILAKACNHDPEKRFRNTREFQAELPRKLRPSSGWERYLDRFADWRRSHPLLVRQIQRYATTSGIALLIALIITSWLFWLNYREYRQLQRQAMLMYSQLDDSGEMYERYLRIFAPEYKDAFDRKRQELTRFCNTADNRLAGMAAAELDRMIGKIADEEYLKLLRNRPKLDVFGPVSRTLRQIARIDLLREFPFYERFSNQQKSSIDREYTSAVSTLKLVKRWNGPISGKTWVFFETPDLTFQYVAPGGFHLGEERRFSQINYPFWIASTEVTNNSFQNYCGFLPSLNRSSNAPVEQLAVNDMLNYCRILTLQVSERGLLPNGYIIRLPTEAEWEYALSGAWRGAPELSPRKKNREFYGWFEENSENISHTIRQKSPNRLGLFDMLGNVTEVVTPSLPVRANAFVERGGSFKNKADIPLTWRCDFLFQASLFNWCGFRLVLAPGDMDYFDRMYQLGEPQSAEIDGTHYELFGLNLGVYRPGDAALLAELLGGRLAQLTPEKARALRKQLPHVGHYPTLLGGRLARNNIWYWGTLTYQDGKPQWKNEKPITSIRLDSSQSRPHLYLEHENFKGVGCNIRFPLFLCEWSEEEFANRDRLARSDAPFPLKLKRFRIGESEFLLIRGSQIWCMNKRYAELLGGRLAILNTPEKLQAAARELQPFEKMRIALGGYYKYNRWLWLDGSDGPREELPRLFSTLPESRNNNFIALYEGKLSDTVTTDAFLCEWPAANGDTASL